MDRLIKPFIIVLALTFAGWLIYQSSNKTIKEEPNKAVIVAKFEDVGHYLVIRIKHEYSVVPVGKEAYKHHKVHEQLPITR